MRSRRIVLTALVALNACSGNQTKFDKAAWNSNDDPVLPAPARKGMSGDLMTNHKLTGLSYSQFVDTLGPPDYTDDLLLGYRIIEDYGSDIDPVYIKNLEFTLSKDSIITSFHIYEWKK